MKVSDLDQMEQNDEIDSEIYNALDMSEKILSRRMKVIEVRGKSTRGLRKVCVLLTPDMIDALKYLQKYRNSTSKFLFCRQSDNTPMEGCSVMRIVTAECPGLQEPHRIRTREMRRYLATTTQILDMTDAELKMVADHMGHNVNIHTDVYRLQSSIIEKTKVSRVLMAMENGNISKYQGQNLQDILLDDIAEPVSFNDSWSQGASGTVTATANTASERLTDTESDSDQEIHLSEQLVDDQTNCSKTPTETKSPQLQLKRKLETQEASKCKITRTRWMTPEKKIFHQTLSFNIQSKDMPTGEKLKELSKQLPGRTVAQIRTRMHNIITGKLKKY